MKAGFKPKLFTKKEWEDNRASAAKGSGVGKSLDAWQKSCPYTLQTITVKQIAEAFSAAAALDKALDVAKKKCDPRAQKETIDGIEAYKSIVADYLRALKVANAAIAHRKALFTSLTFKTVLADKDLLAAFVVYAKKKAFIYEPLHTYLLWQAKKFEEAVKLYGKDNDYNVAAPVNAVLMNAFGGKSRGTVPLTEVAQAVKATEMQLTVMLRDTMHYTGATSSFGFYESFLAVSEKRNPIANFVL